MAPNSAATTPAADLACALDRVAFARRLGIEPDFWQEQFLRSEDARILLNISRQAGKSTMAAVLALHQALYHPASLILCLSPSLRQSGELFKKALGCYRDLGKPVGPESETALSLRLENASRIVSLPGTEGKIRGYSGVSLLIVDEAARVPDELYYSVRPMLAVSGGRLIMASTPWGRRGVFYNEWTGGEHWQRFEIPASSCPRIPETFLEEEQRTLPERVYRQEYCCEFADTEDAVFDSETIAKMFSGGEGIKPLPLFPQGRPAPPPRRREEKPAPVFGGLAGANTPRFSGGPFR